MYYYLLLTLTVTDTWAVFGSVTLLGSLAITLNWCWDWSLGSVLINVITPFVSFTLKTKTKYVDVRFQCL